MAEIRKKLSDRQHEILLITQQKRAQAQVVAQQALEEADKVLALILDAHGVPMDAQVRLDQETKELVVTVEDKPAQATPKASKRSLKVEP